MSVVKQPRVAVFDNYWATTLAFARSLGRRRIPLFFYGDGAGRWSRYATRHFSCPRVEDSARFEPWLLDKIRSGEITHIAPTTDLLAFYASKYRDEFSPDVRRSIAPLAEIETCLIKTRFAHVCAIPGHPPLAMASPDSLDGAVEAAKTLGYPLILKPKSHLVVGMADRGRLIENPDQLARYYRAYEVTPGQEGLALAYPELRWPLMQRYIAAARHRVYSVSGVKDADGGIVTAALSYKREQWPPDVGVSTVQLSCQNDRILEAGLRVVESVLSCGIFEVELLDDGNHLYAIDLNPRAFGFVALDMARGLDLPWLWFQSTREPLSPISSPMIETTFEARHGVLHYVRRLVNPHLNAAAPPIERNRSTPTRIVPMLGDWQDPIPMLLCYLHLLRHPRSMLLAPARKTRRLNARDAIAV